MRCDGMCLSGDGWMFVCPTPTIVRWPVCPPLFVSSPLLPFPPILSCLKVRGPPHLLSCPNWNSIGISQVSFSPVPVPVRELSSPLSLTCSASIALCPMPSSSSLSLANALCLLSSRTFQSPATRCLAVSTAQPPSNKEDSELHPANQPGRAGIRQLTAA